MPSSPNPPAWFCWQTDRASACAVGFWKGDRYSDSIPEQPVEKGLPSGGPWADVCRQSSAGSAHSWLLVGCAGPGSPAPAHAPASRRQTAEFSPLRTTRHGRVALQTPEAPSVCVTGSAQGASLETRGEGLDRVTAPPPGSQPGFPPDRREVSRSRPRAGVPFRCELHLSG